MVLCGRLISAAGLVTVLAVSSSAHAYDNQLQPDFEENTAQSLAADTKQHHSKAAKIATLSDDDLPDALDLDDIPFLTVHENSTYLRADVGFGAPFAHNALTANGVFNPTLSGPALFGVGAGYKLGQMLRTELAAEYRSRAGIQTADGMHAYTIGGQLLANVYADIGTWYGVTPYVGAGAGVGWSKLSFASTFNQHHQTDFVWALSGGFAVEMTPKVSLDIGYRYLDTGTRRTSSLTLRESGAHDLRVGLRWRFGETADLR